MLASLVETGVRSDRRRSFRCKNCAQISFAAASVRNFNGIVSIIQEQGYDDVLLDLGSQIFVTEQIHCKKKDVACSFFVSMLPIGDLRLRALILTGLFAGEYSVMDECDNIQHARHHGHLRWATNISNWVFNIKSDSTYCLDQG